MKASLVAAAGTVATIALIAGCSSSGGTWAKPDAKVSTAQASGTETITGKVTGAAALANAPVFPVVLTGPVNTTGTFTSPNGNGTHATLTFRTNAGLRLTVECRKVLDDESILAALAEVMAQIKARRPTGDQAAA